MLSSTRLQQIKNYSFATLISYSKKGLFLSHINLIIDDRQKNNLVLLGHVAKGNPQAKQLQDWPHATAIFKADQLAEVALHAHGKITVIDDESELMRLLDQLVEKNEAGRLTPWKIRWDKPEIKIQMKGIEGFSFEVDQLEEVKTEHTRSAKTVASADYITQLPTPINVAAFSPLQSVSLFCPKYFKEQRSNVLEHFIKDNSAAMLLTYEGDSLQIAHIDMELSNPEGGCFVLSGNLPVAYQLKSGTKAIAVIMGPHTYISPTWYKTENSVPTWNYTTTHLHGVINILPQSKNTSNSLMQFELCVEHVEGKFKLNQNRTHEDRMSVIEELSSSDCPADKRVHDMMKIHSAF